MFITACTDARTADGTSLVTVNADGSRPAFVIQLGSGLSGSFAKDGDLGVVTVEADGSGTDIVANSVTASTVTAGSLAIGSQVPPQYMAGVGATTTIAGGISPLMTIPVPVGKVVTIEFSVNANIAMPVPGILLPGWLDVVAAYANYGASGPCLLYSTPDNLRTAINSPFVAALVTVNVSGNDIVFIGHPFTAPAWVALTAYAGGFADSSVLPDAVGDSTNAVVANGGHIYVCTVGGTSAASGGPTGTGAGAITDGTVTWYYVSPAAGGLSVTVTVTLSAVKTG